MARETYVLRDGELVPKHEAPPRIGLQIISDTCDAFVSHADGQTYTSKSRYRAELRAHGMAETGNDRTGSPSMQFTPTSAAADIRRVMQQTGWDS